jgi:putative polyhydroxyalkanoate system protein
MPDISIRQQHQLSLQGAKQAAQTVADQMAAEFGMRTQWQGDVLSFERDGLSGTLALQPDQAQVDVTLGMLFKALAPMIEEKLSRKMAKVFSAAA